MANISRKVTAKLTTGPVARLGDLGIIGEAVGIVIGDWVAGTNSVLSIAAGRARATAVGVNNPRISKQVTGLTPGNTYRIQSNVYQGTASGNQFFRVSDTQDLTLGDYMNVAFATGGAVDHTFVTPAGGMVYIGIVAICDADGKYSETDENFTLTAL